MEAINDLEQAMLNFSEFVETALPIHFSNIEILRQAFMEKPSNPFLLYVLPRAVDNVLCTLVFNTVQAWQMMNELLRAKSQTELADVDNSYCQLKRIRDKILGHGVQVLASTRRHQEWFEVEYKDVSRTKKLIEGVAARIAVEVERLSDTGILRGMTYTGVPPRISDDKLGDFVSLLRENNML